MATSILMAAFLWFAPVTEPPKLFNAAFEETEGDDGIVAWSLSARDAPSYSVRSTTDQPHKGQRCALIQSTARPNPMVTGDLSQSIDATEYRNKRITFSAYVRADVQGVGSQARLYVRVVRTGQRRGFIDREGDGPILIDTWKRYRITADIDADAETIHVGCMLLGIGKVWVDSAALRIVGSADDGIEAPRRLTTRGTDNLVAFARLYGYVRHFHPSDEAAQADWNRLAIDGIRKVESAPDAAALSDTLLSIFKPVAPTLRVFASGDKPPLMPDLNPPSDPDSHWIKQWIHNGCGQGTEGSPVYNSRRAERDAPEGKPSDKSIDPQSPFEAQLPGGVTCLVPTALWCDDNGTLPRPGDDRSTFRRRKLEEPPASPRDRATRLAAVVIAWNILQHFYPYFDVVDTDWNQALTEALTRAATDRDGDAFLRTMQRLVHHLHDGHGHVVGPGWDLIGSLPLACAWVGDQLVVTAIDSAATDRIKPGDVVLAMNDKSVAELSAEASEYVSAATSQWRNERLLQQLLSGPVDQPVKLKLSRNGDAPFVLSLTRAKRVRPVEEHRPEPLAELRPGIYYVDIDRVNEQQFGESLSELAQARGVIFDLRGYPSKLGFDNGIGFTIDREVSSARWNVPVIRQPDRQGWKWNKSSWQLKPKSPKFKGKIVYLTGGGAISAAETWMAIIEHYQIAPIIGGPTAGTNGNVNPFQVPGGYRVHWTGMKVLKHDGSQHHGVGISPTIPVERTIKGIADGRDEVLERGLEEVSR